MATRGNPSHSPIGNCRFEPTVWSQVYVAGRSSLPGYREALEQLCSIYWYPIYAFLRRRGSDRQEAEDLTQGFFAYLLEKGLLETAAPEKGRFRSFLLGTLKNFVSNHRQREHAAKRGGRMRLVSLDETQAEGRYLQELTDDLTPDKLFDHRWAATVLAEASKRFRAEYQTKGQDDEFIALQPYLTGENPERIAVVARQLKKSDAAVRSALLRLRRRFQDIVRQVVSETVLSSDLLEEEMNHLRKALRIR